MKKNGLFANGLIWFGAATSLAEIEAGVHCKGQLIAVLFGHLLGFALLFATGAIGGRKRQTAMQTTAEAFGEIGSRLFAGLNVLQLIGWAAVMISMGALAASALLPQIGFPTLCCVIGGLAAIGLVIDFRHATVLSFCTIALLSGLASFLTINLISLPAAPAPAADSAFAAAFELSVAMPLSWLPLISDYTKDAERPVAASFVSAAVYSAVSVWMYVLGMTIASVDANGGIAQILLRTGLGIAGLVIIILSTSLSAFFDLYSSGESSQTLFRRIRPKLVGLVAAVLGIGLAISGIQERYANFLYLISSVFAPMAAVLLVSHYLEPVAKLSSAGEARTPPLRRCGVSPHHDRDFATTSLVKRQWTALNVLAWLTGFVTYQFADASPIGPTLTAVLVSSLLAIFGKIRK